MAVTNNNNLKMVRLDPERMVLFGKLPRGFREKDADILRRAIDALAEKEGITV